MPQLKIRVMQAADMAWTSDRRARLVDAVSAARRVRRTLCETLEVYSHRKTKHVAHSDDVRLFDVIRHCLAIRQTPSFTDNWRYQLFLCLGRTLLSCSALSAVGQSLAWMANEHCAKQCKSRSRSVTSIGQRPAHCFLTSSKSLE